MRGADIQDALLSVKEVAAFAWSLLELLLTRILPLAGFLAGHLLLHFTRLLASVVNPTAGRRVPRAEENFRYVEAVAGYGVPGTDADYHNEYSESLKRTDDELEERPLILRQDQSLIHADENTDAGAAAATAPAELAYHDEDVADTAQPNRLAPVAEAQVRDADYLDVAESSLSDHDLQRIRTVSSATAPANEVQARGNEQGHVAEADEPRTVDVAGVEQGNVSSKEEGSSGKMDLQPSDVQTREEASRSEEATSTARSMRKSGRRRMRVLPPSLSQIKRSLMERSTRRASPSPSPQTPSPSDPITPKKKQLRGSRKRASPSSIKASFPNTNFMRNFRKHFLLDPTESLSTL